MNNVYAGKEIVELGVEIEKNGQSFYKTLARHSKERKIKDIFLFLSTEEGKHIKVFEKILQEHAPRLTNPGIFFDDYFAYLSDLADAAVFTQPEQGKKIASKVKSTKEALRLAIGFEKDSIVFYEGMKKLVPGRDRAFIDAVIMQEERHLRRLLELD